MPSRCHTLSSEAQCGNIGWLRQVIALSYRHTHPLPELEPAVLIMPVCRQQGRQVRVRMAQGNSFLLPQQEPNQPRGWRWTNIIFKCDKNHSASGSQQLWHRGYQHPSLFTPVVAGMVTVFRVGETTLARVLVQT